MRFSSGLAGVCIVTFALMGSIGIGFLLNGNTDYETVDDYNYVTDVTGLYDYTPVANYSQYSPAQNNYQYSTTLNDLGTYTSGINFTKSAAANLNPVITPESGVTTQNGTFSKEDLTTKTSLTSSIYVWGTRTKDSQTITTTSYTTTAHITPLSTLLDGATMATVNIAPAITSFNYTGNLDYKYTVTNVPTFTFISVIPSSGSSVAGFETALEEKCGAYIRAYGGTVYAAETGTSSATQVTTYTLGEISNISINPNGTTTYTYTYGGTSSTVTKQTADINVVWWESTHSTQGYATYTKTTYTNVDYLDSNDGVSLSGSEVYWNNGSELGASTWTFKKPTTTNPTDLTFTSHGSDNVARNSWTVYYNGTGWHLRYINDEGLTRVVDYGTAWEAIQVTDWYTGQIQVAPVTSFTNFTAPMTLGPQKTYALQDTGENSAIAYYKITKTSATSLNFACTGTQIRTGNTPGAMFNAKLTVANYFPDMEAIRINFDSAAYIGTSVKVGSWTMTTNMDTLTGTFPLTIDGNDWVYEVDLSQPWMLTWTRDGKLDITFTMVGKAYQSTFTLLEEAPEKIVELDGQWVVDTDLYEVGSHQEEVYDWNFGEWGLDASTFIVTTMGLTALLAIGFKLAGVSMGGLDFVVLFGANVILWIVL